MTLRSLIEELREHVDVQDEGLGQHIKTAYHKVKAKLTGKKIPVGHSRKKFHAKPHLWTPGRSREIAARM